MVGFAAVGLATEPVPEVQGAGVVQAQPHSISGRPPGFLLHTSQRDLVVDGDQVIVVLPAVVDGLCPGLVLVD